MIYPVSKPPLKPKKQKTRLKVHKPLKAKSRLKAKNKNPLPAETREEVFGRDGYQCLECRATEGLEPHHVKRKSGASPKWIHDLRNLWTLCWKCHDRTETDQGFYHYIQLKAVKRFGWFAGQAISVKEFIDKYLITWLARKSLSFEEWRDKYERHT